MRAFIAACLIVSLASPWSARAATVPPPRFATCPAALNVPKLTLDQLPASPLSLDDRWQIMWNDVAISDAQLAKLSGHQAAIDLTQTEMSDRGTWVYAGLIGTAGGLAITSVGWVLVGAADGKPAEVPLIALALGGLALTFVGMLFTADAIQTPLEPHLAPTTKHRLTRQQAEQYVYEINRRMDAQICDAD